MTKKKKHYRWEQGRWLHGELLPSLENVTQCAVMMFCWFHASGDDCVFDCSAEQIAKQIGVTKDYVKKTFKRLESGGVITTIRGGVGRGNPSVRKLTGRTFDVRTETEKGSPGTPFNKSSEQINGGLQCEKRGSPVREKGFYTTPTQKQNKGSGVSLRDATPFDKEKEEPPEAA